MQPSSSPDTLPPHSTMLVSPTDHDKRAVQHYATEFLEQFGSDIEVSSVPQSGQTVALYVNNLRTAQDVLSRYPNNPMILVMTRATRHEADTLLRQRSDVIVETVSE